MWEIAAVVCTPSIFVFCYGIPNISTLSNFTYIYMDSYFVCMSVHIHLRTCIPYCLCGGQRVGSFLLPHGSWGWNSCHWTWQQASLSVEPSPSSYAVSYHHNYLKKYIDPSPHLSQNTLTPFSQTKASLTSVNSHGGDKGRQAWLWHARELAHIAVGYHCQNQQLLRVIFRSKDEENPIKCIIVQKWEVEGRTFRRMGAMYNSGVHIWLYMYINGILFVIITESFSLIICTMERWGNNWKHFAQSYMLMMWQHQVTHCSLVNITIALYYWV